MDGWMNTCLSSYIHTVSKRMEGNRQLVLPLQIQLTNVEGVVQLENRHFASSC